MIEKLHALASKNYIMEVIDSNYTFFITFHREITRPPLGVINDGIQSIPLFVDKSGNELKQQVNKTHSGIPHLSGKIQRIPFIKTGITKAIDF